MSDVVPPVSSPSADDPYRTSPPPPAFDRLIVPHAGQQRMALSIGHGLARARIRVDPAATALISIDPGGGLAPHVQVTPDRVRLAWPPSFGDWMRLLFTGARSELAIVLHPDVEWTLAIRGGAADVRADLSAGRCAGVEIAGGCTEVELMLPRPSRPTAVRISGGARGVRLVRPADSGVVLAIAGGAVSLRLDDQALDAIGGPTRLHTGTVTGAAHYELSIAGGAADVGVIQVFAP